MRAVNDEAGYGLVPQPSLAVDTSYHMSGADWGDEGGAGVGLTANAEAAGFSPVRFNKARQHTLDVDPRTKLKIINVPADQRVAFADMQDVIMHVFVDCLKVTSLDRVDERVVIVTDQTLLLCGKDGGVARCVQVDRIQGLVVGHDSRTLGVRVPSEYDMLLKFQNSAERDNVIKVLRTVYRRLSHSRLGVEMVKKGKKLDPSMFKIKKPSTFRLTLVPQRTKDMLRQALEVFEKEEEAMLEELDLLQDEMEARHQSRVNDMDATMQSDLRKLQDTVAVVWDNDKVLQQLRAEVERGRRSIEQVDGPFTGDGEMPQSKDAHIAELELIVARLNAAVYASSSDQHRRVGTDESKRGTTYFHRDLQSALYGGGVWPGDDRQDGDLSSFARALTDKIEEVNEEILQMRSVNEQGRQLEQRIAQVEERIVYLSHASRTAAVSAQPMNTTFNNARSSGPNDGNQYNRAVAAAESGDANGNPLYDWVAELPAEITVQTLKADPRTGLQFVDVPEVMRPYFADAVNAVLHFFAVVKKPSKTGEMVKRVLLIGDQAMYLCTPNGTVKRCIDVLDIDEIFLDTAFGIGLRSSSSYDMVFTCVTGEHRAEIVEVLQKIYRFFSGGRAIPIVQVQRHQRMEAFLKLVQPTNYVLEMTNFRPRQALVDAIREKRNVLLHNAPITSSNVVIPQNLKISEDQYLALRSEVAQQMELEWRQDSALVQLRTQIDSLQKQVDTASEEARDLRRQWDSHNCEDGVGLHAGTFPLGPGSGILPSSGPGTFRPHAEGLFFINVTPQMVNCTLEVQRIAATRDTLFTGHSNGSVHVWDLAASLAGSADAKQKSVVDGVLLKKLTEHTGRITALQCSQIELLSASADSTVRRWDLNTGRCTAVLSGHKSPVASLYFSSSRLVTGGNDRMIQLWDLERSEAVQTFRGHNGPVNGLKFEGDMLVSIEWGAIMFWDLRNGKCVRNLQDEFGGIQCLDFKDGIALVGSAGGDITVWDVSKGTGETISGHTDDVNCVQLTGSNALSAGNDGKMRMWDLSAMKSLGTFDESEPYITKAFTMEGRRMIAAQSKFAKVWTK